MKKILILCIAFCSLMIGACSSNTKDANDNKPNPYEDQLKVLAIGNSFSDDSVDELWKIATSWGIEDVTIGMLYIGGTSLQDHYNNILKGESGNNYTYFKYQGIHRTSRPDQTIKDGLIDEPWDVIMVQQVSGLSGVYESYNTPEPYLQTLLDYIKNCPTAFGIEKIYIPGEIEESCASKRLSEGIFISNDLEKQLKELADHYGVEPLKNKKH